MKLLDQIRRGNKRKRFVRDVITDLRKENKQHKNNEKDTYIHYITEGENNREEDNRYLIARKHNCSERERKHIT